MTKPVYPLQSEMVTALIEHEKSGGQFADNASVKIIKEFNVRRDALDSEWRKKYSVAMGLWHHYVRNQR